MNPDGACDAEPGEAGERLTFPNETRSVSLARHAVQERLEALGLGDLVPSAALVVTELVANAVLHTSGPVEVQVASAGSGVRLSVYDTCADLPVVPVPSPRSMTGRGLMLVRSLAARVGFERAGTGKVVWAEVRSDRLPGDSELGELIEAWADTGDDLEQIPPTRVAVELGEVPTHLLLEAKAHVDNLVREFTLASWGEESGHTAAVPPHLAELIETVVNRFSEARLAIKRQALEAARQGLERTRLRLVLEPAAADAGLEYLKALDEADAYCRAARLLTLESPPRHRLFRHWYVGELVAQLRRAGSGFPLRPAQPFEERLLQEVDAVARAWAVADRAARLYAVSAALSGALTPETVAEAVLTEGVAALGASGGGLVLPGQDRLKVPGTVGYDASVVEGLRSEAPSAELPAAVALRSGEPVWMESHEERDSRFPGLAGMERGTVSMCAVPLRTAGRVLGALRFSFSEPRLFDTDERRFIVALADQAAQALHRSQLYRERLDVSARLQRGLLPPALPRIPGVDLGAAYHPFGDGMEVGGDFYDVWPAKEGWFFAVGDVCGTGPEAATMTALVRHSLRAITRVVQDETAVLQELNDILLHAGHDTSERFCTLVLGLMTSGPGGVGIRIVTGGHPGPIVRRAGGDIAVLQLDGSLLGVLDMVALNTAEITLQPGDSMVLYTDGVIEARGRSGMFETDGLVAAVGDAPAEARGMAEAIEADVVVHSGGVLHDDMAVLVLRAVPEV
ncbi:MAG TPA: SpoIIE family protein phosphatase [Acidimicrobiales bacterium]|nr:SpoIIE family protein phosphatase [Acidimicrobiales bacterium]